MDKKIRFDIKSQVVLKLGIIILQEKVVAPVLTVHVISGQNGRVSN